MNNVLDNAPTLPAEVRPWIKRLVRVGYAAKGVIYLLIGVLALQLALGEGGRVTNASGILRAIVEQPLGHALLLMVGVGILAYAGWEIAQAIFDTRRQGSDTKGWIGRLLGIIKAVVYGTIGWEALRMVLGNNQRSQGADDYARTTMSFPLGGIFLGLVGIGVGVYGVMQIRQAWQFKFDDELDQNQLRREGGGWVLSVGRWGIGARGIILAIMGYAIARAGFDRRPSEAGGIAESLWTLLSQPYGHWLLAAVAAGLICFGFFQLLHARYARLR
jgi:hypothetical protein